MAKTKEELNALRKECESLVTKLHELTEDEINMVTGGAHGQSISEVIGEAKANRIDLDKDMKIRIRGAGGINEGGNPLYVVDGIPLDTDSKLKS